MRTLLRGTVSLHPMLAGVLVTLAFALAAPPGLGSEPGPADDLAFPIDDANPKASVPTPEKRSQTPLEFGYFLMELTERGEAALKEKDFPRAARYFDAVAFAVPEVAVGHRKLCLARLGAGDYDGAIPACREATGTEGSQSGDLARFLTALLARPAALSVEETAEFEEVVAHAEQQNVDPKEFLPQVCELAVRTQDAPRLENCVNRMRQLAPQGAMTAAFTWALAMQHHDENGARKALAAARAAAHDPAKLAQMEEATEKAFASGRPWIFAGLGIALLAGIAAFAQWRRGKSDPNPLGATTVKA